MCAKENIRYLSLGRATRRRIFTQITLLRICECTGCARKRTPLSFVKDFGEPGGIYASSAPLRARGYGGAEGQKNLQYLLRRTSRRKRGYVEIALYFARKFAGRGGPAKQTPPLFAAGSPTSNSIFLRITLVYFRKFYRRTRKKNPALFRKRLRRETELLEKWIKRKEGGGRRRKKDRKRKRKQRKELV